MIVLASSNMALTKKMLDALNLNWLKESDDFIIGTDNFSDLEISSTSEADSFYYFFNKKNRRLIKQFLLEGRAQVDYLCQVILIKKEDKFTPRIILSVRDKNKTVVLEAETKSTNIKALDSCHENFWRLIHYLSSLSEIDIPNDKFSLMSQSEAEIVSALQGRDPESITSIIRELSSTEGVKLTKEDINQLLKRRDKLKLFKNGLDKQISDEGKWQDFFEKNKWIFGYGLDYQILKQEQAQPHYGGTCVDGSGGERGDYLTSTIGDCSFTVLVEIKTPMASLLHGTKEIRNGAWSLSKELTDALSQLQANLDTWNKEGSMQVDNRDRLENKDIYTVQPKGILVIGSLKQLDTRDKRETFQRFRKSIHGVDILTFDELYNRASFIVENID
jgi:hypothetical protein